MSEEMSFEQMLEDSIRSIHNGSIVEGKVISVKPDEAVLNIGYKADGILTSDEYSNTPVDLTTVISVGDELTVKVLKVNDGDGQVALSYKRLAAEKANKRIEEAFENKEVLKAPVVQILKGGLSVDVDGGRVFIPASLVSDVFERDLKKYLDQEIEFVITEFEPRKRRIIGDRKQLVAAEKEAAKQALLEKIEVGQKIDGVVKSVVDFGAFVDIGGADGLLHISEMSWGRVGNPRKLFKPGDEITTFIKDITDDKIALSLKFEDTNPWANAAEKFAVGAIVTGKVARMTDFGAFVEIEPGVDALLHVSQIAKHHVDKPSDELKVGEEIEAKIVDFNEDEKKISLSRKILLPDEEPVEEVESVEETEEVANVEESEAPVEDVVEETAATTEETVEETVETEDAPEAAEETKTEEIAEETEASEEVSEVEDVPEAEDAKEEVEAAEESSEEAPEVVEESTEEAE